MAYDNMGKTRYRLTNDEMNPDQEAIDSPSQGGGTPAPAPVMTPEQIEAARKKLGTEIAVTQQVQDKLEKDLNDKLEEDKLRSVHKAVSPIKNPDMRERITTKMIEADPALQAAIRRRNFETTAAQMARNFDKLTAALTNTKPDSAYWDNRVASAGNDTMENYRFQQASAEKEADRSLRESLKNQEIQLKAELDDPKSKKSKDAQAAFIAGGTNIKMKMTPEQVATFSANQLKQMTENAYRTGQLTAQEMQQFEFQKKQEEDQGKLVAYAETLKQRGVDEPTRQRVLAGGATAAKAYIDNMEKRGDIWYDRNEKKRLEAKEDAEKAETKGKKEAQLAIKGWTDVDPNAPHKYDEKFADEFKDQLVNQGQTERLTNDLIRLIQENGKKVLVPGTDANAEFQAKMTKLQAATIKTEKWGSLDAGSQEMSAQLTGAIIDWKDMLRLAANPNSAIIKLKNMRDASRNVVEKKAELYGLKRQSDWELGPAEKTQAPAPTQGGVTPIDELPQGTGPATQPKPGQAPAPAKKPEAKPTGNKAPKKARMTLLKGPQAGKPRILDLTNPNDKKAYDAAKSRPDLAKIEDL